MENLIRFILRIDSLFIIFKQWLIEVTISVNTLSITFEVEMYENRRKV